MDCADLKAKLSALVDDQVDAPTRHAAERHMAGCAACRALLDEAEALDDLMARDADALTGGPSLPAGFEAMVLQRALLERPTVRRSLVTWTGWFAAAACLMLAVLIWAFDRQMLMQSPAPLVAELQPSDDRMGSDTDGPSNLVRAAHYQRRSWTFDGALPASAFTVPTDDASNAVATDDSDADAVTPTLSKLPPSDAQPLDVSELSRATARAAEDVSVSADDAQTLYAVSLVMEMLEGADLRNFAEVERIRQITEYDDLLPRLAQTKQRLTPEHRAVVRVAESILLRIVRGPITEQVARELWADASDLSLAESLEAMSRRPGSRSSL